MSLERIRPTHAALFQNVKITLLVSLFIWGTCRHRHINPPYTAEYGWEWNEQICLPFWIIIENASFDVQYFYTVHV